MKTIPFYNSLNNSLKNNIENLVSDDSSLISILGSKIQNVTRNQKIIWFESPYGYSHLKKNNIKNIPENYRKNSLDAQLQNESLTCIFIRPSIHNLLDDELIKFLQEKNFSFIDSGNQIFYLMKENLVSNCNLNISKKRISKIKKGSKLNNLLKCDTNYLIENNLFFELKNIYYSAMQRKNASPLYYFENLWNLPTTFNLVNAQFYIALDRDSKKLLSFLIIIGEEEQNIFLSSSSSLGLQKESASFLRFNAIKDFLENKDAKVLNMGGVNKKLGGDDSFKKSFGGKTLDYKIIFKMNRNLYSENLKNFKLNYDENNLRFWL